MKTIVSTASAAQRDKPMQNVSLCTIACHTAFIMLSECKSLACHSHCFFLFIAFDAQLIYWGIGSTFTFVFYLEDFYWRNQVVISFQWENSSCLASSQRVWRKSIFPLIILFKIEKIVRNKKTLFRESRLLEVTLKFFCFSIYSYGRSCLYGTIKLISLNFFIEVHVTVKSMSKTFYYGLMKKYI